MNTHVADTANGPDTVPRESPAIRLLLCASEPVMRMTPRLPTWRMGFRRWFSQRVLPCGFMDETDCQKTPNLDAQRWVNAWMQAGPALDKIRREEVKLADTASAMRSFTGSVLNALRTRPPAPTSGLVEQQRIFRKIHVA